MLDALTSRCAGSAATRGADDPHLHDTEAAPRRPTGRPHEPGPAHDHPARGPPAAARTVDGPATVVIERTFHAPATDVWAAVTEPERLVRWIGTWSGARHPAPCSSG